MTVYKVEEKKTLNVFVLLCVSKRIKMEAKKRKIKILFKPWAAQERNHGSV